jgi:hypothetical protein
MIMVTVLPLGIILLAMISAIVAGIIIAVIKGGTVIRWILGAFLVFILLGFMSVFAIRLRPVVIRNTAVPSPIAVAVESVPQYAEAPDTPVQSAFLHSIMNPVLWQSNLEEELTPDVYSSLKAAACGLGIQLQETLRTAVQSTSPKIFLVEDLGNVDIVYLEELRRGLKIGFPEADIVIVQTSADSSPASGQFWITVSKQDEVSHSLHINELDSGGIIQMAQILVSGNIKGALKAIVRTDQNSYAKQVEYDYRPWLYAPDQFRTAVNVGRWAVIASSETVITQQQAQQQVMQTAKDYLAEQIQMQSAIPSVSISDSELRDGGFIVDEYTQRLQGISGPIWRAAMLLDVRPERLQLLQNQKIIVQRHVRQNWANMLLSLAGMIVLVSLLYAVINSLTKGYYSFVLALISILVIAGFLVFFVLVI